MRIGAVEDDRARRPIRFAGFVTLAYLLATLPLVWRASPGTNRAVVAIAHVAGMVCLWWATRARSRPSVVAEWLPLLIVPLLYAELPYLMGTGVVYHDPAVQRWEAALFAGQPARTLAGALPHTWVSELLHLGYLSYYLIIYVPPFLFYLTGRREAFGRALAALMLTYAVCFLTFSLVPVQGPRYVWPAPANVSDGPIRSLTLLILERGSSRGAAFPSSHAAVAVAQAVVTTWYNRWLGVGVSVASLMLMIGAVYGGFHYAIDIVVGAAIGLATSLSVLAWRQSGARSPNR